MSDDLKNTKLWENRVAVVTMWGIFAMISFVTNMAAPFGTIWQGRYEWGGMMGNAMNFLAYLIMGIPAGRMLAKRGYKRTALAALAIGFVGMTVQWLSCKVGGAVTIGDGIRLDYLIYLTGAFVCGFCVCMLNTVANPLLNSLGGGGNRGNQLIQTGGTLNSLTGALTPLLVGVLVGTITSHTSMADVQPLMFIAMGVFLVAFGVISAITIPEPKRNGSTVRYERSAFSFRHTVLGIIAIFFYVGLEVGIPGEMLLYFSDVSSAGAGVANGVAVGGAVAAVYWLLMMV
ncbi:MAG: MFS transporter, partial [Bacteroidales bacterium]|nr:MFS transporter [Bacteroidales bacterium]